jgi:hypothetical protein
MFIATLTEDCALVEGMETALPDTDCRLGLAWSISAGHLIFKDHTHNEILKTIYCSLYEPNKSSEEVYRCSVYCA